MEKILKVSKLEDMQIVNGQLTRQEIKEIENYIKENEDEQQARTTNEIVQSIADALKIEILPEDERQQGYNETGDKLFNIIYKIIKNN